MPTTLDLSRTPHTLPPGLPDVESVSVLPRADAFDSPEWMFEPEYDGLPARLYASGMDCELRMLREVRFDGEAELRQRVARVIGGREAILDGVIVSLDRKGKPNLRDLLQGRGFLAFAASDLLWLDGRDLRPLPLAERKARLARRCCRPTPGRSTRSLPWRSTAARCSRPRGRWTWRESWPSGRATPTDPAPPGTGSVTGRAARAPRSRWPEAVDSRRYQVESTTFSQLSRLCRNMS